MFICNLTVLILVLTLHDQVHTGDIFGGKESVPHSRPYMVLLEILRSDGIHKYCGGFLLNEDFVMTAAHCQAKSYKVFLGLHNYHQLKDIQEVSVGKAFPHKNYNPANYENDIMLLKLSHKAKFSENVKPISLGDHGDGSLPQSCVVSGWGRTEADKFMSAKLLEVNVTLIDEENCAKEKVYCSKGKAGPGVGDSGGPLVCGGKAYGVVSRSTSNQIPDDLTIYRYTKIPDYRDWIKFIIENNGKY